MKVKALLRDTQTGEEGWHEYDHEGSGPDEEHSIWYLWIDGNYSCDCNRLDFIYGDDGEERVCSDGRVELVRLEIDGRYITSDADERAALERVRAHQA
jgi:hypothetical protein